MRVARMLRSTIAVLALLLSVFIAPRVAAESDSVSYATGAIDLLPLDAVLAMLDGASVTTPRSSVLDAYEHYLADWRTAELANAAKRGASSGTDTPSGPYAHPIAQSRAAVLQQLTDLDACAAQRERLEDALFAAIALASDEPMRAKIANLRAQRALQSAVADQPSETVALGAQLADFDVEAALMRALPDDHDALAAAMAALDSTRARRISAIRALCQSVRKSRLDFAADMDRLGVSTLSMLDYMELRAADRALRSPDSEDEPVAGTEFARIAGGMTQAWAEKRQKLSGPASAVLRAQWDACRVLLETLPPPARWKFACRMCEEMYEFNACNCSSTGIPLGGLLAPLLRPTLDNACRECLHGAIEKWRVDFPLFLVDAGSQLVERQYQALGKVDVTNQWYQTNIAISEQFATEFAAFEKRALAPCGAQCVGNDEESPDWLLLANIPEAKDIVDAATAEELEAEQAAQGETADPLSLALSQVNGNDTPTSSFADLPALLTTLRSLGMPEESADTIRSLHADYMQRWGEVAEPLEVAYEESFYQGTMNADGVAQCPPCVRADAERIAASARVEADFQAAIAAALGTGLSDSDAALLRMACNAGNPQSLANRSYLDQDMLGALRVNPALVVISAQLSPAARRAAVDVLAARESPVCATIKAERDTRMLLTASQRGSMPDSLASMSQLERLRFHTARQVHIDQITANASAAARAARVTANEAINAVCNALSPEDAARVRTAAVRRGYPDAHRSDAEIAIVALTLCDVLPPEDIATRVAIATAADAWRAEATVVCQQRIERLNTLMNGSYADTEALRTAIDASGVNALAAIDNERRVLAVERLRVVAPAELRARCKAWRSFCLLAGVEAKDHDLHSAP